MTTPDQTNDMMIRAYRDTKSAFACYDIAALVAAREVTSHE